MSGLIISVHVPKTAGRSFGAYLSEVFKEKIQLVYPCRKCHALICGANFKEIGAKERDSCSKHGIIYEEFARFVKKNRIKCIHGHIHPFKMLPAFGSADYVVWLRDPVERTLSHFEFLKRRPDLLPDFAKPAVKKNNLGEFVSLVPNYQSLCLDRFPLSRFSFIGVMEHMEEDMHRFSKQFKIPWRELPTENVNPGKGIGKYLLDNETRGIIESANRADIGLYNEALALRGKENSFFLKTYRFGVAGKRKLKNLIRWF